MIMTKTKAKEIIGSFPGVRIMVVGDLMLDRYLWGDVDRISPEAPVPVVRVTKETENPGGAANVAASVRALGARVALMGVVGDDSFAAIFKRKLAGFGIRSTWLVKDSKRPTTVKTRIVAHSQQVVRIDRETSREIGKSVMKELLGRISHEMPRVDGIIISDYGKGTRTYDLLSELISIGRSAGKFIAVDPKEIHFRNYRDVSVITPNHHEAGFVSGRRITSDKILEEVGWELLKSLNLESILITRGEKGMALFEQDGARTDIPAEARTVYDVTGAGDTVIAALTVARLSGASMKEAAYVANVAAGLAVARFGTARVTREELLERLLDR
jgi:rfaE bifunctional protein kinase chain/domain